ncbi:MAG: hypothetical protein JNM59_03475 [Hyphomonadaceae bacterium]|nr:hypothetical protein [Hyphomonadaceae bacterium]
MLLDPMVDGAEVVIADDLLAQHPEIDQRSLVECRAFLERLLGDETIPNADLKGMLNRLAGPVWGGPFGFGPDAKSARRFLETLQTALTRKIK